MRSGTPWRSLPPLDGVPSRWDDRPMTPVNEPTPTTVQAGKPVRTTSPITLDSSRVIPTGYLGVVIRRAGSIVYPMTWLVDFGWRYGNRFVPEKYLTGDVNQ